MRFCFPPHLQASGGQLLLWQITLPLLGFSPQESKMGSTLSVKAAV